ncbi:MAG: hypothetical protein GTO17_07615 [Candidatus Aminicenantes bacterium]|nr:hypothetical protein [Candidatus Aminicenantes bacterium]
MMIPSCHHIGLFTNDPKSLIKFYTEKLGFDEEATKIVSAELMDKIFGIKSPCTLTKLKLGQIVLEVIAPQGLNLKPRDFDVSGYNHWALGVADKERFCQELKQKGVAVLEVEREDRKIFFVKDLEGNLIEIYERS